MNVPLKASLPSLNRPAEPLYLEHYIALTKSTQRRLQNRCQLVPLVNLNAYRFKAVVDWVEIALHFGRATQAQHVQKVLRRFLNRDSHIKPLDLGNGATFTSCAIRIQEPASLALVVEIYQSLKGEFGEAAKSQVRAIEVSFDAYPRTPSDDARARLLGALQRTIWTDRDIATNPLSRIRAIGADKKPLKLIPPSEAEAVAKKLSKDGESIGRIDPGHYRTAGINATMYLGARDHEWMMRLMDKVSDRRRPEGPHERLADDAKRVRVEVSLKGIELLPLGLTTVPSLRRMKITSLKKRHFRFKLPTFAMSMHPRPSHAALIGTREAWRAEVYLKTGVMALLAHDAARGEFRERLVEKRHPVLRKILAGKPRVWTGKRLAPSLVTWDALHAKIDAAFRQLDLREETEWKRLGLAA